MGKPTKITKPGKYTPEVLLPMFRKAAQLRNEMLAAGFTDNGGAIHSASRILDILGQRLRYPGLSHINGIRRHPAAEFSEAALHAHQNGTVVWIEHVSPLRALTVEAIALITAGANDDAVAAFVKARYRLLLLTREEMADLNRLNRSKLDQGRVDHIKMAAGTAVTRASPPEAETASTS